MSWAASLTKDPPGSSEDSAENHKNRDFKIRQKPGIRNMILATEDINDMLKNRSDLFTHLNGMNREAAQVLQKMIKSRSKEKFTAHHVQILLTT